MNGHVTKRVYARCASGEPTKYAWQARYRDPWNPRKRLEKTFEKKATAERWLRGRLNALEAGTHVEPGKAARRWEDVVAAWKETRWPSLAPRSRARYDQVLRTHLDPEFGGRRVADIDREAVRRYFGRLAARVEKGELSGGTVHKIHTTLSAVLSEAVEIGLLPANPARRVRGMPSSRPLRKPVFLTPAEVRTLADAMPERYRLLVLTAGFTGLRSSELLALRRRHVDVLHGRIRVEEAIKEWKGGEPTFGVTKSGRGRTVGLEPGLKAALVAHLDSLPGGADTLVFRTRTAAPSIRSPSCGTTSARPSRSSSPSPSGRAGFTTSAIRPRASSSPTARTPSRSRSGWGTPRSGRRTTPTAICSPTA